jgi:hypothetical protein
MRKYQSILIMVIFAGLFSCKKEDAPASSTNPLAKVVSKAGSDSIVSEYSFDGAGRLAQEKISIADDFGEEIQTLSIVRDGSGKATRVVYAYAGSDPSTEVTDYAYNGSKVKHGIWNFDFNGLTVKDSIAFTYANKVSKTAHYLSLLGTPATLGNYNEYTYDGRGNMTQAKLYSLFGSGSSELTATISFEYDTNINPWYSNDDVLVEYVGTQYISPNNVTKVTVAAADPSESYQIVNTYEYGSDKRPIKATSLYDGTTYQVTYTYKK